MFYTSIVKLSPLWEIVDKTLKVVYLSKLMMHYLF